MISKTITSVAIIIAVATMFISSSTIVNSVLAKTTTITKVTSGKDKNKDTSSSDKSSSGKDKRKTHLAASGTGTSSSDTGTSSSDKSSSNTAEQDYKDFQKCLSDAEDKNGFATK